MILLWLLCAGVTGQEPCSSPGDFPSPTLSLSTSSVQVGDSVLAWCSLPLNNLAALVIFCQDGKDISSQKVTPGRSLYQSVISVQSSGQFRCMYLYKNDRNQVKNSRLSLPWTLNVAGQKLTPSSGPSPEDPPSREGWRLAIVVGIAVGSFLILVPVTYLLVKKVASKQRRQREQGLNSSTENVGTDDLIQYAHLANISTFGKGRRPRQQETETATYAVIGKACGRPS